MNKHEARQTIQRQYISEALEGWEGLKKASIEHYFNTGKVTGGLLIALEKLLEDYLDYTAKTGELVERIKAIASRKVDGKYPFMMPTDKQLVEIAILFNEGKIEKEKMADMVAMNTFILRRLHEHGDVTIKATGED